MDIYIYIYIYIYGNNDKRHKDLLVGNKAMEIQSILAELLADNWVFQYATTKYVLVNKKKGKHCPLLKLRMNYECSTYFNYANIY